MRFSYQIGMSDADHYLPLVQAAEAAGFDGITIPDSICYPQEASSKYPYNKDGSREFLESVPFLESLIAVAAMAAVTDKIRFATFVYKLAVRQVAVVAKQVQSIQALSSNRFDFGVGISPWEEDFVVCDVPWEKRGLRLDEEIDILRGLETGECCGYEGEFHTLP
ncbi:MAG: LLM class flavin-dependent oxidoreductase, partial [Haliea sp.]